MSYPADDSEIYVTRPNTSFTSRLTNHPADDYYPRLNREATVVAFVSDRDGNSEIYRVNVDGTELRRLTANAVLDTQPVWSPDNLRLAFASERDGNLNIYAMNADGSRQIRLTSAAAADLMPSWSPDGQRIAWVQVGESTATLWVMQADGSNPRPVTGPLSYLQHPVWSPDGTRIAFDYDANGDGWNDLAVINADGSGLRVVSYSPRDMYDLAMGSWSPDGQRLLFTGLQYMIYQGRLVLGGIVIGEVPVASGESRHMPGFSGNNGFPDMRRIDETPPETTVETLPQYSRPTNLPIIWGGVDRGGSQMAFYDVQYRVGANGTWVDWMINVPVIQHIYTGVPGTTVYFRSRGRDNAGNVEAWSANADTSTTFYTWALSGQVTDNRGVALPDASIAVAPTPANTVRTQPNGWYTARLTAEGNHTLGASQAGYGSVPGSTLRVTGDRAFDLALPPLDSALQNGGFEAQANQLSSWTAGGSLPVETTAAAPHTGAQAAALGQSCPLPCVGGAEPAWEKSASSQLAVDSAGSVHMVWIAYEPDERNTSVYHATRPHGGAWTTPTRLGVGYAPQIAIDGLGRAHLAWYQYGKIYYAERSAAGAWTTPAVISSGYAVALEADAQGGVHLLNDCSGWSCPGDGKLYYVERLPSGGWQQPSMLYIGSSWGYFDSTMTIGLDGTLHVLWVETDVDGPALIYQSRRATGAWTPREALVLGNVSRLEVAGGPAGELHLLYTWDATIYLYRSADGMWSASHRLPAVMTDTAIAADHAGTVHLLTQGYVNSEYVAQYYRKEPNMEWAGPTAIGQTRVFGSEIAVGRDGRLHLSWTDSTTTDARVQYQTTALAATPGSATLRQTVTIPAAMHRPTLSWMYSLTGAAPANGSRFEVQLTSGDTTATIFSADAATSWRQAWADLQPWAGQTVDLTFVLHQSADAPHARLLLDDLSLGSWLTPVITAVAPARADAGTSITIEGENFIATPTVYVNNTALSAVRWLDEQTLQATLPPTLRPGAYTVTVVNPGGQKTALANSLRIGWQVYVARVARP